MRRMAVTVAAAGALAGCALTPHQVLSHGERVTHRSTQSAGSAARCIARNAENLSGFVRSQERSNPDGSVEIIIRSNFEGSSILAIGIALPRSDGAEITITVSPHALAPETLKAKLPAGC